MKNKGYTVILTGLLALSLVTGGCMIDMKPAGKKFNKDALAELKAGVTTEAEILKLIGEPINKQRNSDGSAQFTYFYATSSSQLFNPWDFGQKNMKQSSVTIFTDTNGKFQKYMTSGNE